MKTNGFDMNMVGVFINVSLDEFGGRGGVKNEWTKVNV